MVERRALPTIVSLDDLNDGIGPEVLLHVPGEQWSAMTAGFVDGKQKAIPAPKRGMVLLATAVLPLRVQPPPKGDRPRPGPMPPDPDVLLSGYCACDEDGLCAVSVENMDDPYDFRVTCTCFCPPDVPGLHPTEPPCGWRLRRSDSGWRLSCEGACGDGECTPVWWPVGRLGGRFIRGIACQCA